LSIDKIGRNEPPNWRRDLVVESTSGAKARTPGAAAAPSVAFWHEFGSKSGRLIACGSNFRCLAAPPRV
jgi:hypothetical protein